MDTCKQNMQQNVIASMCGCNCDNMKNKKMGEELYNLTQNRMGERNAETEFSEKMKRRSNMVKSYVDNYECPCVENMPLAMAYVPWQEFDTVYESEEALSRGTIFPELDLPFYGRSCSGV